MAKKLKRNQPIITALPNGKVEPYGDNGHSFYVNECKVSLMQYKSWLKRAIILEERIESGEDILKHTKKNDANKIEKIKKIIERNKLKLKQLDKKIEEFEGE